MRSLSHGKKYRLRMSAASAAIHDYEFELRYDDVGTI